jgi:hypothetical protein
VPSAEQADNRRRGRAEDRIPPNLSGQNRPVDAHRGEQAPGLARQPRGSHHLRTRQQQVSPSVGMAQDRLRRPGTLPLFGNH